MKPRPVLSLLCLLFVFSLAGGAVAADTPDYDAILQSKLDAAFEKRREAYEARTSPEDIAAYQRDMKAYFAESVGGLSDERCPLNARITGTVERDGYSVEKIFFQSLPGFHVTGALFLPDEAQHAAPWPGVLLVCGHAAEGKANEGYQRAAALLALNGMACFMIDPISQGERYAPLREDGRPLVGSCTTSHSMIGHGSTLLGENVAKFMIWDGMRAIDYLQSRDDIDGDRIGCLGNSGGGTQTAYLMALDDRIQVASPSCYITTFDELLSTIGPQDGEQNIFGQVAKGMDHADYIMMRAPKPTLICAATQDFFDIGGTWDAFRQAKRLYSRLGHPEQVDLTENDDTHGYKQPLRESATRWMHRWLLGGDKHITEPAGLEILTAEEIQVTPRGQVLLLEGERSAYDVNRDRAEALAKARARRWAAMDGGQRRAAVADAMKLPTEPQNGDTLSGVGWIRSTASGFPLPYREVAVTNADAPTVLIAIEDPVHHLSDEKLAELKAAHPRQRLVLINLPGYGEAAFADARWYRDIFGDNAKVQLLAYLLGDSLLQWRTAAVLAALDSSAGPVKLMAGGKAAAPALVAAHLRPGSVSELTLKNALVSWEGFFAEPVLEDQVDQLHHGVLETFDLPMLRADLSGKISDESTYVGADGKAVDP